MPSPFPGMDPYLEDPAHWSDFHLRFINSLSEAISDRLPDNYAARLNERSKVVDVATGDSVSVIPDVAVDRPEPAGTVDPGRTSLATEVGAVDLPLTVLEEETEGYIEIVRFPDHELVTVLEVLSPSNKVGDGRKEYILKRNALLRREVHLVELDLLVGGRRMPTQVALPSGDYFAIVARHELHPVGRVYHFTVRHKLPTIPIPLKAPDPDVLLDLGAAFTTAFDRGRFHRLLNYARPLEAPLADADRAWAAEIARAPRGEEREQRGA